MFAGMMNGLPTFAGVSYRKAELQKAMTKWPCFLSVFSECWWICAFLCCVLPTTAQCRLVFACSHLHVLVCTSGTWDESNKFHFDASDITSCQMTVTSLSLLVWHISSVRDPHCLLPKSYSVIFLMYGHVGVHLAGFLSLSLLSYIFMLMLNVTLCGESLAQTGAHRHRIC